MTTSLRLVLIGSALASLMVGSLGHSHAAGALDTRSPFHLSSGAATPEPVAFQSDSRASSPREIASGSESTYVEGQQVVLNIRPCKGAAGEFVRFHWPFRRTVVGSVKCGTWQVQIVQIEQQ